MAEPWERSYTSPQSVPGGGGQGREPWERQYHPQSNWDAGTDLVARAGSALTVGAADLGMDAGSWLRSKVTGQPWERSNLLQRFNQYAGIEMDPDAGIPMQVADVLLPGSVAAMEGNPLALRGAIPLGQKLLNLGKTAGLGAVDSAVGYGAQKGVEALGGGEGSQIAAALVGGSARPLATRAPGVIAKKLYVDDPAGAAKIDKSMRDIGAPDGATFGQMANARGRQFEKTLEKSPLVGRMSGITESRAKATSALDDAHAQATGDIASGPAIGDFTKDSHIGSELRSRMEDQYGRVKQGISQGQEAVESAVVSKAPLADVSATKATLEALVKDPQTGAEMRAIAKQKLAALQDDIDTANPGVRQTITQVTAKNLATQKSHAGKLASAQAKQAAATAQAASGKITLSGKKLADHIVNVLKKSPKEGLAIQAMLDKAGRRKGAVKGKVALTFNKGDPGYDLLTAPTAAKVKMPAGPKLQAVPPEPKTAGYGSLKDAVTAAGKGSRSTDGLKGKALGDVQAALKKDKYAHADTVLPPGKARKADVQSAKGYSRLKYLEKQVGEPKTTDLGNTLFQGGKGDTALGQGVTKAVHGDDIRAINEMAEQVGAKSTLKGIGPTLRNMAYQGNAGEFRTDVLTRNKERYGPKTRAFVAKHKPAAAKTLENVETGAAAMHQPPGPGNLQSSVTGGAITAALMHFVATHPRLGLPVAAAIGATARSLNSSHVREVMAGRRAPSAGLARDIMARLPALATMANK